MKPTKARLKDFVRNAQAEVFKELNRKQWDVIFAHVDSWLDIKDPEQLLLKEYYKAVRDRGFAQNALVNLFESEGVSIYGFNHFTDEDFMEFKRYFLLNQIDIGSIPGTQHIKTDFSKEKDSICSTYQAILSNLDRLTPKKGVIYLDDLGFDVSVFKTEEAQLPMIVVDKEHLILPANLKG